MSFSTLSGPIRSGTVRQGAAKNTGVVELVQTAVVPFSVMTTAPTAQALFTLPAGAKIMAFQVENTTAISGGGVTAVSATFGTSGTANAYMTTASLGITSAKTTQATLDAAQVVAATDNIGTSDVTVYGTFTATTGNPTAGSTVVSVYYIQRASDGSMNPTSSN